MKKLVALIVIGFVLVIGSNAFAQTANQTVTYEVQAINEISVSGNPGALIVSSATAGSEPTAATMQCCANWTSKREVTSMQRSKHRQCMSFQVHRHSNE